MMWRTLFQSLSLLALLPTLARAQFGFFEQMFQGQQQQQQQQRQRQQPPSGSQWTAMAEQSAFLFLELSYCHGPLKPLTIVDCSQYLCPTTLLCVPNPIACPCPSPEDIQCVINDHDSFSPKGSSGTVVCVRGSHGCVNVERLLHPKW